MGMECCGGCIQGVPDAPAGNTAPLNAFAHIEIVIKYLKNTYPFWNKNQGKDHVFWVSADR
jgi:hypothetical protein